MAGFKFALKLLIAAGVIWLVWDKFNPADFALVASNPRLLAVIPVCWLLNQLLTSMRLHAVLHALGRPTRLADVMRANMSSLFVGNLLPGVIGADVVKFYYIKKHDPAMPKAQLALVLALDRVLGLIAVLFWCSFFSLFIGGQWSGKESRLIQLLTYMPLAALLAIVLALAMMDFIMKYLARYELPVLVRSLVGTYRHLMRSSSKRALGLVMLYNLAAVFIVLSGLVFVGAELQLQHQAAPMVALQFFLIPLVLIASMLPLTPMGIGIAQFTMAGAYQLFGLEASLGVSISTLSQLGLLGVSILVGGAFFLAGKRGMVTHEKST